MPEIAPEVAAAFTEAAVTAFQELCQTPVIPGPIREAGGGASPAGGEEVFAVIGLRRGVPGRLELAFPEAVLRVLAGRYLPEEAMQAAGILEDTAGEFANVIAGQAKTMLKGTPYHFMLTTPQVGRVASEAGGGPAAWVLPFESDAGAFTLLIEIASPR